MTDPGQPVLHVITGLRTGGAETALYNLLRHATRPRAGTRVVSLTDGGRIAEDIRALGIPVECLGGRHGLLSPAQLGRLRRLIIGAGAPVVQAWMYHANVVCALVFRTLPARSRPRLYTSVRGAAHAGSRQKWSLRVVRRADALLSRGAQGIVFNSRVSARQHVRLGYDATRITVIPNGFDTGRFRPDDARRTLWREQLGAGDRIVVGIVARRDVLKDHPGFLDAAARLAADDPRWLFVCAGSGCGETDPTMVEWVAARGLTGRVRLLGECKDVAGLYNALDVLVSSSISEAFPNVVGEAMASGVPVVATDVGDCADLVGDTGLIVPPGDPAALAGAIRAIATEPADAGRARRTRSRERIVQRYSVEAFVAQYEALYAA